MKLTSKQAMFLKTLAHDKKPVILLGHKGVTDAVVKETGNALLTHELIKVRLIGDDKDVLDADAEAIAFRTGAALLERIGKVAILYKRHPEEPKIVLPRDKPSAPTSSAPSPSSTTAPKKKAAPKKTQPDD
ncbi:MAG TPA: YhbY family RNA-binding protein [Myxococcota bacterium]